MAPERLSALVLVLLLACGGCASIGDLEADPQQVFTSAKSPEILAGCIAEKWSNTPFSTSPAAYQPRADGAVVALVHLLAGVDAVSRIRRTETGSRVDYAERMPAVTWGWVSRDVRECL